MADPRDDEQELEALAADEAEVETEDEAAEQDAPEAPEDDGPSEVEKHARILGWKPPAEWKGEPPARGFMSAEDYVAKFRDTPAENAKLRERLDAIERETQQRLERMDRFYQERAKREMEALRQQQRRAVETGDVEEWERLEKQREAASQPQREPEQPRGPDPAVQEWKARNGWFESDPALRGAAMALADEAIAQGYAAPAAQLAYVERVMSERGLLPGAEKPKPKARVAVDDGPMMAAPRNAAPGWDRIPSEDRKMMMNDIKSGIFRDKADAAKAYWAEYG